MIHQPQGGYEGQASDIGAETSEILRLRGLLGALYANLTGQPLQKIALDLDRDNYLSSHQARAYGLVDSVAQAHNGRKHLVQIFQVRHQKKKLWHRLKGSLVLQYFINYSEFLSGLCNEMVLSLFMQKLTFRFSKGTNLFQNYFK